MRKKFAFTKSDFTKHSSTHVLVLIDRPSGHVNEVRTLLEIPVDPRAEFAASAVAGISGGDELVHVTEPGRHFDHVFYSDHEKLYTIEELGKETRLAKMPFVKDCVAKSLKELFDNIELVPRDQIEDGVLLKKPTAAAKKTTAKKPTKAKPLTSLYLESKETRSFWHLVDIYAGVALVRSGKFGARGSSHSRRLPAKSIPALIERKRAEGFTEVAES
jgi:hypothetical protein